MTKILDLMRNPVVFGQVRHLLSTAGGVIASKGWMSSNDWELYMGLAMALISLVLSATAKEKKGS